MTIEELDKMIADKQADILQIQGVRDMLSAMVMKNQRELDAMQEERSRMLQETPPQPKQPVFQSQIVNNYYGNTGQVLNDIKQKPA